MSTDQWVGRTERLTPREIWGPTWEGEGQYTPGPKFSSLTSPLRGFFRTEMTWLSDDFFVMHDTTTWEGGEPEYRDAFAKRLDKHTVRVTYDGVEGGMLLNLQPDGFRATYRYHFPLAPPLLSDIVLADVTDENYVGTAGEATQRGYSGFENLDPSMRVMHDTLVMHWKGELLGSMILRLTPVDQR